MKKALIGAGGFAREIKSHMRDSSILCFIDDIYYSGVEYTLPLSKFDANIYEVIIAVGDPKYRFDLHKGYPTKLHKKMLRKYGPCKIHRKSFKPVAQIRK